MSKLTRRLLVGGLVVAAILAAIPALFWASLTHRPSFYKAMVVLPRAQREEKARRFVSQSLQLRNDIANEPSWEAAFSDEEVNAWLAEDLVTHFADHLPPEVHEPRVMFELERITLAFELDRGPLRSVIWVVARPRVPEPNVLELTLEKVRAGMVPIPPDQVLDRIVTMAATHGIDVSWKREANVPVATIKYTPEGEGVGVKLDRVQVFKGEVLLAGRSERGRGEVQAIILPTRKVLQSKFPLLKRKAQFKPRGTLSPLFPTLRTAVSPTSPTS
ncbi:MAG: hypothetical protein AB7I30_14615 [Isosphaeraceae bacterium]